MARSFRLRTNNRSNTFLTRTTKRRSDEVMGANDRAYGRCPRRFAGADISSHSAFEECGR